MLAFDVEDLKVLMAERTFASREQLWWSHISDDTAIYEPLFEFGFMPPAAQFCLPTAFAIASALTLRYFSRASQDRSNGPSGPTRRHRFCKAAQMKMDLRFTDGIVAEFAVS